MSNPLKPKIVKPKEPVAKEIDYVQNRGASGRTILGGMLKADESKTQKKSILGG